VSVKILPIATQQCRNYLYDKCEQIKDMKLEGYNGPMCNKHVHSTMTRSSRFHCPVGVIKKLTTDITCIQTTCCGEIFEVHNVEIAQGHWPRQLREHSLITRLTLHMANSCTEFEVSSVCRCGDITWGVKFYYKGSPNPDHAPFREDFSSAGWDAMRRDS